MKEFVFLTAGGVALGIVLGGISGKAMNYVPERSVKAIITIITAFSSYRIAEALSVSGIIAKPRGLS